jgi:hypothetical protein
MELVMADLEIADYWGPRIWGIMDGLAGLMSDFEIWDIGILGIQGFGV